MAGENIVQGAVTEVIIQPTWGTIEGNGSPGKEDNFDAILNELRTYLDAKADKKDVYTKDDVYTKTETDDLLDEKSNTGHTHDDRYYTESEIDTKLAGKSDTGHTHDDRYYTESEIDTKLSGKANSSHTHTSLKDPQNSNYTLGLKWSGEATTASYLCAWSDYSGLTKVIQAISPANVRTVIGAAAASHTHSYLPLTGGTTTGGIIIKHTAMDSLSPDGWKEIGFSIQDKNSKVVSIINGASEVTNGKTASEVYMTARVVKSSDSKTADNRLRLYMFRDGTAKVEVTHPAEWRTALSAAAASHTHSYLPLSGGTTTGPITNNQGGSWVKARDFATIKTTSYNGASTYYPLASSKTNTGNWSLGSNAATDDSFIFSFVTDANYNNNSNTHIGVTLLKPTSAKYFIIGTWGTSALTDGTSALNTGSVYFQY